MNIYLWKCALLPNVTFRILKNINTVQELSQWYIKCCLEGVKTNSVIHRGLAIWERKGKLSTQELKAINRQLKDGEKVKTLSFISFLLANSSEPFYLNKTFTFFYIYTWPFY